MRSNGTNIDLEECTDVVDKTCSTLDMDTAPVRNCKEDHQCTNLDKMYRCERGKCWNITSAYSCEWSPDDEEPPLNCAKKRNCVELEGRYNCRSGFCSKIRSWSCERRCSGIPTTGKNVLIMSGDQLVLGNCRRAVETRSGETVWDADSDPDKALITSCTTLDDVTGTEAEVRASDCINGTLISKQKLLTITNYTSLLKTFQHDIKKFQKLDDGGRFLPYEEDITIFNKSRLMINHEGCVNTLQEECHAFYNLAGNDGRNSTSPSRFPCYYAPSNPEFVVQRYDPMKTRWLFLIGFLIPASLLILSCGVLFTCSRILNVDNDGRMSIECCKKQTQQKPQEMQLTTSGTLLGYTDEIEGDPL